MANKQSRLARPFLHSCLLIRDYKYHTCSKTVMVTRMKHYLYEIALVLSTRLVLKNLIICEKTFVIHKIHRIFLPQKFGAHLRSVVWECVSMFVCMWCVYACVCVYVYVCMRASIYAKI